MADTFNGDITELLQSLVDEMQKLNETLLKFKFDGNSGALRVKVD